MLVPCLATDLCGAVRRRALACVCESVFSHPVSQEAFLGVVGSLDCDDAPALIRSKTSLLLQHAARKHCTVYTLSYPWGRSNSKHCCYRTRVHACVCVFVLLHHDPPLPLPLMVMVPNGAHWQVWWTRQAPVLCST